MFTNTGQANAMLAFPSVVLDHLNSHQIDTVKPGDIFDILVFRYRTNPPMVFKAVLVFGGPLKHGRMYEPGKGNR